MNLHQHTPEDVAARGAPVPRRILGNAGVLFGASILTRGLRVAVFFVLARHLGLREFGALAFVVAYTEIFRVLADFGVDTALMRRLAMSAQEGRWITAAAALKGASAVVAYALGVGMARVFGYPSQTIALLAIGLVGVFLSAGANLLAAPFQASLQSFQITWTGIVGTAIYVLLAGMGALTGQPVVYFLVAGLVAELTSLFLAGVVAAHRLRLSPTTWDEGIQLLREALPIGAITLVVVGYGRAGLLLLERMRGTAEVGTYVMSLRVVEILLLLAGAIAGSMYPEMAHLLARHDFLALRRLFGVLYRRAVAGVGVMAVVLILLSPILRHAGPEIATVVPTLRLLAWSSTFMIANQLSAALLLAAGLGSRVLIIAGWNLLLNVALNMLLIPQFGSVGVAVALLGTEGVNTLIQSFILWRRFQIPLFVGLWVRTVGACAAGVFLASSGPALVAVVLLLYVLVSARQRELLERSLPPSLLPAQASRPEKLA